MFSYHCVCLFTSYHVLTLQKLRNSTHSERGRLVITALCLQLEQGSCLPCFFGCIWVNTASEISEEDSGIDFFVGPNLSAVELKAALLSAAQMRLIGSKEVLLLHS